MCRSIKLLAYYFLLPINRTVDAMRIEEELWLHFVLDNDQKGERAELWAQQRYLPACFDLEAAL